MPSGNGRQLIVTHRECVPPKYGPNRNLEKQGLQTKVGRYKLINKDRLDIIPITPATTSSAINVPSNNKTLQGLYLEKATVTNGEKHSHKNTNDQSREMSNANKKQTKDLSIEQNRAYSRQISETSTCSSSVADHCPVSDVEELLPPNFIFNKTRTESSSTVKENLVPNIGVGEESNENAMTNINNPELNEETTINNKNNSNSEDNSVSNTVIVKDNSMEITRGNSNENVSFYELTDNDNLEEVTNDIILERVDIMEESDDDITTMPSSTDNAPKNKLESKDVKLNSELYNLLEEIKEKLQKCASDSPEVKMQIIKEVFGDDFKDEYASMLHCSVPKKEYKIELKDPNEVITIDDDEDGGHSQEHHKKLKTAMPSASSNLNINEIVIIDDEEKDNNTDTTTTMKDVHNSDCSQNSISLIDQNITKNEEVAIDEPKEQPNSGNISAEETASPTPNGLEELSVVTDVVEAADSLIANEQSVLAPETPAIEDISSDEETVENFRLQSCYKNKISCSSDTSLAVMETSDARRAGRYSVDSKTTTSTSRCSKELESGGNTRKWNCLGNITQFEEDTTASSSVISVQPSWDLNYSNPKNTEESDFSLSPAYQLSMMHVSPLASPCFLEDNRYSRVSPITSPTNRFPPNFTSPNRSVPTSPVVPLPSLVSTTSTVNSMSALVLATSSVVPTTTSVVQTTSVIPEAPKLNNRVNWQNWFAEEKRKGFFDFERSQSVESGNLSRRQSLETVSSVNSDYDNYCEIKIDSKVYRIKRSIYEKIPKGKLCYIRENNTFIRYFDDSQMELFIHNLNISEGSSIASDLLKQIKGRVEGLCDIDTSLGHYEASGKSEVITLSKDVTFSTEDYLSDPELYVEEVEKVQLFVPRDFYGFYKYVTGYQIVNHHPPISFQTFLTMHNTNGIRGLFKNFVNTLIEGHTIL
ncbi:hypothetical protein NQ314_010284 [Rhamnusium bicolor]|uniref:Uncharacterized protein n=1 Tax=Rhamnusium bicolor TaxID=1586634 RepID=A0AAV8XSC2_9CUCU|nr:hypothetical protein NQ314_010284 [Rhamnusium bicolor]